MARKVEELGADERRAGRALAVVVEDAAWGWRACSPGGDDIYHLTIDPKTGEPLCTCPDFVYRHETVARFECKHIHALYDLLGRRYLEIVHELGLGWDRTPHAEPSR